MQVKLIKTTTSDDRVLESLTIGQTYEVLGLEADSYRLIDDTNQPYLFDPECFEIVDSIEPSFWVCRTGEEGERYCYPLEWDSPGFFEDFFDGKKDVIETFWQVYRQLY